MKRLLSIALLAATLSATDQLESGSRKSLAYRSWKCGEAELSRKLASILVFDEATSKAIRDVWEGLSCEALKGAAGL